MKLLTLHITNFKAIRDLTIDADGQNLTAYGENGVGKTSVGDAVSWNLFGKDLLGRKDFEIKTVGEDGEPIHFLDHCVEATFAMANGSTLSLSRTYRENWVKQRGSATDSFTGHTTTYTVNGVPQTATEYEARIASICNETQFRLLTNPAHFLNLSWQERRKILFDFCGDMTDQEVIEADPELAELPELMGDYSIEEFKKVVSADRVAVNKERESLPARIDEANRAIPAEDKTDWAKRLPQAQETLRVLQDERANLSAGGKIAELRAKLIEIGAESHRISTELRSQPDPAREQAISAKREIERQIKDAELKAEYLTGDIDFKVRRLASKDAEIQAKRDEYKAENARTFTGASECPACKRPLAEDKVQAAVEEFNVAKARKLADNNTAGKELAAKRAEMVSELDAKRAELAEIQTSLTDLRENLNATEIPAESAIDPSSDPRIVELSKQHAETQRELDALAEDSSQALADIDTKIEYAQAAVEEAQSGIANQQRRKRGMARVTELKARERELAAQYEALEKSLHLCEQFVRAKVRLLTEQINSRFTLPVFRLFKEQVNGGIAECCDVLWRENGALPSNGQAVQIGLDIIAALSRHLEFAPPIFVDNAESVTSLPVTPGQQIRLVVSEGDKVMRIERSDDSPAPVSSAKQAKELALAI